MDDSNPYESPQSDITSDPLAEKLAVRLLELRGKPYTYRAHYRQVMKPYILIIGYFGLVIGFSAWAGFQSVAMLISGLLVGTLLRDFGLARAQKRIWRVQTKFIDWDKVERASAGERLE